MKVLQYKAVNRPRIRCGNCEGMTIVEVLIGLTLVMILLGGLYAGVLQGIAANHAAAQRISAFGLCKDLLETMRGAPYAEVNTNVYGATTVEISRSESGNVVEGTRWTEITPFFFPPRKQVTVRLEWTYRNQTFSEFATGIIYFRGRRLTGSTGGVLAGQINLNPNNSPQNQFHMVMADGTVISRSDLLGGHSGVSGRAQEVHFQPKGPGSQNSLLLNGEPFNMSNSRSYLIQGNPLNVQLVNTHPGQGQGQGQAMGQWSLSINSPDAMITVQ